MSSDRSDRLWAFGEALHGYSDPEGYASEDRLPGAGRAGGWGWRSDLHQAERNRVQFGRRHAVEGDSVGKDEEDMR